LIDVVWQVTLTVQVSPLSEAVTVSATAPIPLTTEAWLLNRVVAPLFEAWSACTTEPK
jgi:hypothetical protein